MEFRESKDIGFLLKFVERERLEGFLKGEINFSPLKYFNDKAKNDHDDFIADEKEGAFKVDIPKNTSIKLKVEGDDRIFEIESVSGTIQVELDEKDKAGLGCASFFYISMDDMKFKRNDLEKDETIYVLKDSVIDYFKAFNEDKRIPVLIEVNRFLKTLKDHTERQKNYGPVHYYKNNLQEFVDSEPDKIPYEMIPFYKDEKFKEQREWRIISRLDKEGERQCINFGDISSFSLILDENNNQQVAMIFKGLVKKDA